MKIKTLILTLSSFMLLGCAGVAPVKAEGEKDIPGDLKALMISYIGDGKYTKKTTICLNNPASEEVSKYFHAKQTDPKRTTYYDDTNQQLLMAKPDGTLDASYGGYRFVTDHVERFHIGEGATLETMFTNTVKDFNQGSATSLNDFYTNLTKFAANGYFTTGEGGWGYTEADDIYYHNYVGEGDKYFGDMLGFAAPMLYTDSGNYLTYKSVTIKERFDANATPYLSIRIHLNEVDKGKLTGEIGEDVLSEARVYKGIRPVGDEDLSVSYFLKTWIGGTATKNIKMVYNPSTSQYELPEVALALNERVKVWSTENRWFGTFDHDIDGYSKELLDTDGNYQVLFAGNYGFYYKPADGKIYISAPGTLKFYLAANWDWGTFNVHIFKKEGSSKKAWPGDELVKVADNVEYKEGQTATVYSFTVEKTELETYPNFIISGEKDSNRQQTQDMYWSWYNTYSYNAFFFVWDEVNKVNSLASWTYIPA